MHHYSMQKISSIHKFILKIQQVVGSHELNDYVHFGPHHPKVIQATFNFDEFVPACKKSAESICSFQRQSRFQSPMTRLVAPVFERAHPKNLPSTFLVNLYQIAKSQPISWIYSGDSIVNLLIYFTVNLKILAEPISHEQAFSHI